MQARPLPLRSAARAEARCARRTVRLLLGRQVHLPHRHVGAWVRFADGTTARVYRETVVDRPPAREPAVLAVEFRLRGVHGRGHRLFRAESLLNTPLFVGFPGFCSKLWMAHDERDRYRGLYQWDGAQAAADYARALWWVLALVCPTRSISYRVLPGLRRDDVLTHPQLLGTADDPDPWWRPVEVAAQ